MPTFETSADQHRKKGPSNMEKTIANMNRGTHVSTTKKKIDRQSSISITFFLGKKIFLTDECGILSTHPLTRSFGSGRGGDHERHRLTRSTFLQLSRFLQTLFDSDLSQLMASHQDEDTRSDPKFAIAVSLPVRNSSILVRPIHLAISIPKRGALNELVDLRYVRIIDSPRSS